MFSVAELNEVVRTNEFKNDYRWITEALNNLRFERFLLPNSRSERNLSHFCEAVLASAPDWEPESGTELCQLAAQVSEALAKTFGKFPQRSRKLRIRSSLLYELGTQPSLAAHVLGASDLPHLVTAFFKRSFPFEKIGEHKLPPADVENNLTISNWAILQDAASFEKEAQSAEDYDSSSPQATLAIATRIAGSYNLELTATELRAFSAVHRLRRRAITKSYLNSDMLAKLSSIGFPLELFPAQQLALSSGFLDFRLRSYGLSSPTGSGKTFLTKLLITSALEERVGSKILYIVPSRALVSEVATNLERSLKSLNIDVYAVSAQLVEVNSTDKADILKSSVLVMTPEKADLLVRIADPFLTDVSNIIVDEAHHIEGGTRGALLELYLWRIKKIFLNSVRFTLLSAVTPNIAQLTSWLNSSSKGAIFERRPTRMKVGTYRLNGSGVNASSTINYVDGTSITVEERRAERQIRKGIAKLAVFCGIAGPTLVVAKGKKESENIAEALCEQLQSAQEHTGLTEKDLSSDLYQSLDTDLVREMYSEVRLRNLLKERVAYHHAGLPPKIRRGIEEAIRVGIIKYVVATTTLAEGVNFPFSTVIVQSLALREPPERGTPTRYSPITPRSFWNIAGRAGRPGFDSEGQVILFEPSLGLDKVDQVIDPYLEPKLSLLSPVTSALATAIEKLIVALQEGHFTKQELSEIVLPDKCTASARGAVNLIRIGLLHGLANNLLEDPFELFVTSFAYKFIDRDKHAIVNDIFQSQWRAIQNYYNSRSALDFQSVAELGLSLETLESLRSYVEQLQDWQIQNISNLFYGGQVNLRQLPYVVGPVAKRIEELEGNALGGYLSDLIIEWIAGVPFSGIRWRASSLGRIEDLIAVIYTRIQFLLPWGLWATDKLLEVEAKARGINYDNQIRNLANLANLGVPNFNAARLCDLSFERVDATRLSKAYAADGATDSGLAFIPWVKALSDERAFKIISGSDHRKTGFYFFERVRSLVDG